MNGFKHQQHLIFHCLVKKHCVSILNERKPADNANIIQKYTFCQRRLLILGGHVRRNFDFMDLLEAFLLLQMHEGCP